MKTNESLPDRAIRILLAIVAAILVATEVVSGPAAVVLGVLAVVLFLTGVVGFCPLYTLLRVATRRTAPRE